MDDTVDKNISMKIIIGNFSIIAIATVIHSQRKYYRSMLANGCKKRYLMIRINFEKTRKFWYSEFEYNNNIHEDENKEIQNIIMWGMSKQLIFIYKYI